ncbi:penicillin-insensitive murein endopeptidase [Methyloglobulus sp.]|uniref:penicillin-insensitive murein endopeptidase n=1 Tax=Methyloglobulus sp. TaxID=2518622 RepID=UPI0032B7928E
MKLTFFLALLCFFSVSQAQTDAHAWSRVEKPTLARSAQSIGKYTSGCLKGAATLPQNGQGYQVMRLSRKRYYGHPDLVQFIEKMGETAHNQRLGTLLIGDMGLARGGPTLTGHRSHQTGLDVDIWYLLAKEAEKKELSFSEREEWGATSVLTSKEKGINPSQWSSANEKILEAAARLPEVDRIFVNAHIKQQLCQRKIPHDWLQKIRPWYAHADHFHVRLKCPGGDIRCEKQDPVPWGDGCGADLAWWFSAEAQMPSKKSPAKKTPLPTACDAVLNED